MHAPDPPIAPQNEPRSAATLTLGEAEIHLWHVDPTAITDPARLALYASWLTADEIARQQRFLFERHRHAFLIARALVRGTLSRYVDRPPGAWRFVIGEHGRPELDDAISPAPLRFNLSHTDGRAVLAVGRGEFGVDVEDRRRASDLIRIAEHSFAPAEVDGLRGLAGDALCRRFFDHWTLKEAYLKARGLGISLGLDRFAFAIDEAADPPVRITFDPTLDDDPAAWSFRRFELTADHPVALAIRRPEGAPRTIRIWDALPGDPLPL